MRVAADLDAAQSEPVLEDFIAKALDVLQPYFPDADAEKRLRTHLHIFHALLRDDRQRWDAARLWEESGRDAIQAFVAGLDTDSARDGLRGWAELLEPLMRRCCTLVPGIGIAIAGDETLSDILGDAGLMPRRGQWPANLSENNGNAPVKALRPGKLATARANHPTEDETFHLSALLATERRNKHAHGQWPTLAWRDRIETVEAILLTCVRMIAWHPAIERQVIFAIATDYAPLPRPTSDFGWTWADGGVRCIAVATADFADLLLAHDWCAEPRLRVIGQRGVGLSTLGTALAQRSVQTDGGDDHPFFLIAKVSHFKGLGEGSSESSENPDTDAFMGELLNLDWKAWWVQRALEHGWLGVIADDLEGLGADALRRVVVGLEAVRRKHPTLRLLTLRPSILPASRDADQRGVLGKLGLGKRIEVLGRYNTGQQPHAPQLTAEHPVRLGFWLDKGAVNCLGRKASDATLRLLLRSLGEDVEELWIDYDPACRKGTAIVALNALARIAGALDGADKDEDTLPAIDASEYFWCLYDAFAEIAGWAGVEPRPIKDPKIEHLQKTVHAALKDSGFVFEPTRHVGYRIALPSIEQCVSSQRYPGLIRRRWRALHAAERDALIGAYATR
jgi:hypothetical protein